MDMKTVLITGGSSGIGYGLSLKFAAENYRILWVALDEGELLESKEKLVKIYHEAEVHTMALDLAKPKSCEEVYNWANSIGFVNVLVNNAGFGNYGFLKDQNLNTELSVISVNVNALFELSYRFVKDMIEEDQGTIINISSNSSFETVPRMLTYSSTKAFVKHFSRGLNEELNMLKSKVNVLTICPAAISDTNFRKVNDMDNVKTFNGLATTTTKEVVNDIWKAFKVNKSFQISGWKMRLLYRLYPILPFSVKMWLIKKETELT